MARNGCSRSSKDIDFGTNWKPACNFLLVFSGNLGPLLHRFGDTELKAENLANFPTLSHLELRDETYRQETRVMGQWGYRLARLHDRS